MAVLGVLGDGADLKGANDIINGLVLGDVMGDAVTLGDGGDDVITINREVGGDVLADEVGGAGGNDKVTIGSGGIVGGLIDGQGGFDSLRFAGLRQSQLTGFSPAGGTLTFAGNTYT